MKPKSIMFSTTRRLTSEKPNDLPILPPNSKRRGDGGLRTKKRYKMNWPQKPLFSVITIVFNGREHIEQTIKSVINQTYDNVEYIVVDGGSTDGTLDIIRKYGDEIDYWVSEPDGGIVNAMNKGIMLCTGEYIGMIHSDDWYNIETIETVVNINDLMQYGVICGQLQYWNGNGIDYIADSKPFLLKKTMSIAHPTCFVKKQIYHEYGLFKPEHKNAMDYEFLLRLYINNVRFHSLNRVLANMRHGGNSDKTWKACQLENHRARKKLMPKSFCSSPLYFIMYFIKVAFALYLERSGLSFVVKSYRRHFSQRMRA